MLAGLLVALLTAQTAVPSPRDLVAQAAERSGRGELSAAIDLVRTAATLDEASGEKAELVRDLLFLGRCLSATGRSEEAVSQTARAVQLARTMDDPQLAAVGLEQLGVTFFTHGRYEEARQRLEEALALARGAGLAEASILGDLGMVLQAMGRSNDALPILQTALEEHEKAGDTLLAGNALGNIANLHLSAGRHAEAAAAYRLALAAFEKAGDAARATTTSVNLGMLLLAEGRYDEARTALQEGLDRARREGWKSISASALLHLAVVFEAVGLYDRAEKSYEESLELFRAADDPRNAAAALRGLASLQLTWGRMDRALAVAGEGKQLAEERGIPDQVLSHLEIMGAAHVASGRFNTAILHYRQALDMASALGRESDVGRLENDLGAAFIAWGKPAEAEKHLDQAIAVADRLGLGQTMTQSRIHLGAARQIRGDWALAREAYLDGLARARDARTMAEEAVALDNLGVLALREGERRDAERWLLESIAIRERIRRTSRPENRASALAAWICAYRWLVLLHHLDGDTEKVLLASERMKARHLAERISERSGESEEEPMGLAACRRLLGPRRALVSFANVDWQHPLAIVVTQDAARSYALDVTDLGRRIGLTDTSAPKSAPLQPATMQRVSILGRAIDEYRRLLALPTPSTKERSRRDRLARELFETLLGPAEDLLAPAEDLVVIPEGSVSLVPLETLRLRDGRPLVSRSGITYAPSLRVMELLRRRTHPQRAGTLLAMGGALTQAPDAKRVASVPPSQAQALGAAALLRAEEGRGAAELYTALGHGPWADLPGATAEVRAIGRIVPGSLVLTGAEVSEKRLKTLSREGKLREFRTLHFATHAFAVEDTPELSALVFSEAGRDNEAEDGYLNLLEIARLDMQPDLVTLSACESGGGRIYGGEGTVGLTQAFLEAGANGVSVSLWPVNDAPARDFQVGVYELVQTRGLEFPKAMTEMKRKLLREGKTTPALWAPFVYFGI